MLDYKLGLMSRMRKCAASIPSSGVLEVFLRYTVDPGTGMAKGAGVEPLNSSLARDSDAAALECIRSAHVNATLELPEAKPDEGEFHWATEIILPLENDRSYLFFSR